MASNIVRKSELRKHPRFPLAGTLRLLWENEQGGQVVTRGQVTNVSVSGIQLLVDHPIPVRTHIFCNEPELRIAGRGSVRYSRFAKGKYRIGIDFSGGTGWREPVTHQREPAAQEPALAAH